MKREPRHRPLIRRWLAGVVERALQRVPTPDPRSLEVLKYLKRGRAVPAKVITAAYAVYTKALPMPLAMWEATRAAALAADGEADLAAACAAMTTDSWGDEVHEFRQQIADLLRMIEKELP